MKLCSFSKASTPREGARESRPFVIACGGIRFSRAEAAVRAFVVDALLIFGHVPQVIAALGVGEHHVVLRDARAGTRAGDYESERVIPKA